MPIMETVLAAGLAAAPVVARRATEESTSTIHVDSARTLMLGQTHPLRFQAAEPSLDEALCKDFATIPAVSCVLTVREQKSLKVLIALDDFGRANRYRVYDKQMAVLQAFQDVEVDFHVVPRFGRSVEDLCSERVTHAFVR